VDEKEKKQRSAEEKRDTAAMLKQIKHRFSQSANKVSNPQLLFCKTSGCRRAFTSNINLRRHLASGKCGLSKTPFRTYRGKASVTESNTLVDCAVELLVKDGLSSLVTVVSKLRVPQTVVFDKRKKYKLCGDNTTKIASLQLGYARTRRWSSRTKYTEKQMRFLQWAFELGAKNEAKKLTAERAAEIMALVGTAEGQKRYPHDPCMSVTCTGTPTFARSELVEKWEIKSFFSRTNSVAVKNMFTEGC
jgi:hypothetical protein